MKTCNFGIFLRIFMKFSPKCRTKKWELSTPLWECFCSFFIFFFIQPQIRPRKIPVFRPNGHLIPTNYILVYMFNSFQEHYGKFCCLYTDNIYSCPMKTHHSSDAHICGLSKAVQNCVIYNYYLGQMRCFSTKISIPVTPLTHDVTSASKLR